MPNGDDTNGSGDNGKKAEVISESTKTSSPEKDVDYESGVVVKSSTAQEKSVSSGTTVFSSTTNPANVSKFSFNMSTTSSTGSGKRIVFYSFLKQCFSLIDHLHKFLRSY